MPIRIVAIVTTLALTTACSESKCGDGQCDASESMETCPEDCSTTAVCEQGPVISDCICGTIAVSSGYCCNGRAQTTECSDAQTPVSCADGLVTSACTCGTAVVSSGYCCDGRAQTTECSDAQTPVSCADGLVTSTCTCGTAAVSSGYCCDGLAQTTACSDAQTPATCADGLVTSTCTCGTAVVSSGYCCSGTARESACTSLPIAGNPDGHCSQPLPAEAQPEDTNNPTTVVGTGTAESCSYNQLASAVERGGVITFDCGASPVTIRVTATLELKTDRDTIIDGGNNVTLDGGGSVRVFNWYSPDWMVNDNALILQHLTIVNGKATGTEAIPERPEPCSQGFNDGEGGALFMRDGVLRAIDVTFANNEAALLGPDTGGGAIYLLGVKASYISSCSFLNNRASNAGAMGSLFASNFIYNSLFDGNQATGNGANMDDASKCDYINNDQHEVGSGGNGGAIYNDGGDGGSITICGTQVRNNHSNAFGSALFFTSNDRSGTLTIQDSNFFENKQCLDWWTVQPGISMYEDVYDDNKVINSTFTAPDNWSAESDSDCAPLIDAFSG